MGIYSTPGVEPEPKDKLSPEPEPDFSTARAIWGTAWPCHHYIFAAIFFILMLYNLNSILGLVYKTQKSVRRRKIFLAINILLFFFNCISSSRLFLDPYESGEYFNKKVLREILFVIYGFKIPCLTASFSLVFISLVETTKVKLYSSRLQNIKYAIIIIVMHFTLAFTIHLYLIFEPSKFRLLIICNVFFILFGLVVAIMTLYACINIIRCLRILNTSFRRMSTYSKSRETGIVVEFPVEKKKKKSSTTSEKSIEYDPSVSIFADKSIRKLLANIIVITCSGLTYVGAVIYSLRLILDGQGKGLLPWPWYIFQTIARSTEVMMVTSMSYIVRRSLIPPCTRKS